MKRPIVPLLVASAALIVATAGTCPPELCDLDPRICDTVDAPDTGGEEADALARAPAEETGPRS